MLLVENESLAEAPWGARFSVKVFEWVLPGLPEIKEQFCVSTHLD